MKMKATQRQKERMRRFYSIHREEQLNRTKQYYWDNKEEISKKRKQWREKNKEKLKQLKVEYYLKNRERILKKDKIYSKKYYQQNKEKINRRITEYRKQNPEKYREYKRNSHKNYRVYCERYPEKICKLRQSWIKKNPEKYRECKRVYTHSRWATGKLEIETVQRVYEDNIKKYGTLTCYLCLKPIIFKEDSLDHKIPISRGGTNLYENLAIVHRKCNSKKHSKTDKEFMEAQNQIK